MINRQKKNLIGFVLLTLTVSALLFTLSQPNSKNEYPFEAKKYAYDKENGELIFYASGCGSCHEDPDRTSSTKLMTGGLALETEFGTFFSPNISPDKDHGIGSWSLAEFSNALRNGISPKGTHYYPVFPYASYQGMKDKHVADLYHIIISLEPSNKPNKQHQLIFPFSLRRSVGIWKQLYFYNDKSPMIMKSRGQYLVEVLGHCAECHTPRSYLGGLKKDLHLAGSKTIKNEGKAPNITPDKTGILEWTEEDIVNYLETGFTPDFDSAGGQMVSVISNLSKLSRDDLTSIAKYLKSVKQISSN